MAVALAKTAKRNPRLRLVPTQSDRESRRPQIAVALHEAEPDEAHREAERDLADDGCGETSASEKASSATPMNRIASSDSNTASRGRATRSSQTSYGTARVAALATLPRDRVVEQPLRQPGRRPADSELKGDEEQQDAADQRNRRRHRQAVRKAEHHDQQRIGAFTQRGYDLANADPVRWS